MVSTVPTTGFKRMVITVLLTIIYMLWASKYLQLTLTIYVSGQLKLSASLFYRLMLASSTLKNTVPCVTIKLLKPDFCPNPTETES